MAAYERVLVEISDHIDRAFCAGADLGVLGTQGDQLVRAGKDIALTIRNAPKPVLAAVNGAAAGDWGGSYFLPRLTSISKALELVWSARIVPAAEAVQLGVFDRVVPHDSLARETRALAERWASMAPLAVRKAKAALYRSLHSTLEEMLDIEIADQEILFATPEARQLIRNR